MKIRLTILFVAIASLGFAQKKEIRKIEKAAEEGNFIKAVEIFNTINESDVEEKYLADYTFYKAASFLNLDGTRKSTIEDYTNATAALKKAQELGFDNLQYVPVVESMITQGQFLLAQQLVKEKKNSKALAVVMDLYNKDTSNFEMLLNAANLAYQISEFDQAKVLYEKLLKNNYTGVVTSYTAVNTETNVEELFPSKTLRDAAIKINSHKSPAESDSPSQLGRIVTNLVWLHKNSGDLEKAKSTFESALKNNPNDESLKFSAADNYLTLGMMDKYEEASLALTKEVKDPAVYDNLALAAINTKEFDQAIKYYEQSLAIKSDNFYALSNLGSACIQKGNLESTSAADQDVLYKKAINVYEKAHKLDEGNKDVINTLINLYNAYSMEDKAAALKAKI